MKSKQMGFLLTAVMLVLFFSCGNCNVQQVEVAKSIRVEDFASILHRDFRSIHRSRRSVISSSSDIQELLEAHNGFRRLEKASGMELMIWDYDLANTAEVWADKCIWNHSNAGQNLYASNDTTSINLTAAIEAWHNEKQYYVFTTGQCQPSTEPCLHYSQVVWSTSQKLGCAYKRCTVLSILNWIDALFLVCNYDPPGNVQGVTPYQIGTGCSQCATESWWCNNGLCDRNCSTPSTTCGCAPVCLNLASIDSAKCSCSCAPGWNGVDCSLNCNNYDPLCAPQPGQKGYLPEFCDDNDYTGSVTRKQCPKMCNLCQAVGGNYSTSAKPSLLIVLLVWLSWLLYSYRNV